MYTCPLCKEEFASPTKLGNHLKSGDLHHQLLREVIKLSKLTNKDAQKAYNDNEEFILSAVDLNAATNDFAELLVKKKEAAAERKRKEKEEKKALADRAKLAKIEEKRLAKLKKQKEEALRYKEMIEAQQFKKKHERSFINSLPSEEKPTKLAEYFYNLVGVREYNIILAVASIKSLFFKFQLTPEQVRKLLRYTAETGHSKISDAKFLIEESDRFYEYAEQLKVENTVPHLIKIFYSLRNMKIDKKMFVKNVDRIKSLMRDNNLTYDHAEKIIKYMVDANVNSLFWFNDYINCVKPDMSFDDNHISKSKEIKKIVSDVMSGKMKYSDVSVNYSYKCYQELKAIVMQGDFDSSYNYMEWLYKIKMEPDVELKSFISENNDRPSRFKALFEMYKDDETTLKQVKDEYDSYCKWLDSVGKD